jgi:glycosyltransferase involved in cell wall biosynthesis
MTAAGAPLRAALRGIRHGLRVAGKALDLSREQGLARSAHWLAGRITARAGNGPEAGPDPLPPPGAAFDVIFAVGYWDGEPKRYRVFNRAEELREAGYSVHVMPFARLDELARCRLRAAALVLFRAEYDWLAGIAGALAYARAAGMRIVYDIDDLVFDPDLAACIDGLSAMGPHQRRQFLAAMARRRRLMRECDLVTASTAPLARAAAALGRPSAVIPNSLNRPQLALAAELVSARAAAADGIVRIGYFSGTRTHQRDFAVCEPALLDSVGRHPEVRVRIVGHLELGAAWRRFGERLERIGLLSPPDLLRAIAGTDINLAPLEIGNPFCEAKSELKFFEAAIVGVPTVASATEPMLAAIEHEISGFLARDETEWGQALTLLVGSAAVRARVGEAARQRAIAAFGPASASARTIAALGLTSSALPIRPQAVTAMAGRRVVY